MHETEYVVEILAGHGVAGIRHFAYIGGCFANRHAAVQEDHVGTRTHDFGHNRLGSIEYVVENGAFVLAEIGVGEHAQLLIGNLAVGLIRVEAEQSHNAVCILANQPDDRLADLCEHMDGRHHGPCDLFVALHGDAFRHQFGDDDRTI